MTPLNNPIDPETIKIPAYKRKKSLDAKARHPLAWTALDRQKEDLGKSKRGVSSHERGFGTERRGTVEEVGYRRVPTSSMNLIGDIGSAIPDELSSVKSIARSARNTKRVMTFTPQDVHASSFQRISLEQTSLLDNRPSGNRKLMSDAPRRFVLVGEVTMVLNKISVTIIKLSQAIKLNNILLFEGDGCMFEEVIAEMQIDRKNVKTAKKGIEVGVKMKELPRNGTKVWRVLPAS
ncbi:MAG: hypothetical protein NTX63_03180 [Candidatus Peregrinibacteria bacterium]|nr:hypothetical protein [Candidatus Peregrinibacteria bacterium]